MDCCMLIFCKFGKCAYRLIYQSLSSTETMQSYKKVNRYFVHILNTLFFSRKTDIRVSEKY